MKEKIIIIWINIVKFINLFKFLEFYLLKFLGWTFILIGLYNIIILKNTYSMLYDLELRKKILNTSEIGDEFIFNYFLTFIFIPIIIGCLFIITKNGLNKKNE